MSSFCSSYHKKINSQITSHYQSYSKNIGDNSENKIVVSKITENKENLFAN